MKRLVSRAELARHAGVSRTAITKACDGELADACEGKRVDLDHPAVAQYLARHAPAPTVQVKRARIVAPAPTVARPIEPIEAAPGETPTSPEKARQYLLEQARGLEVDDLPGMTLQGLVERFGTAGQFVDWLDALKKIEDIRAKRLSNGETEGRLIERDLVHAHVFAAMEGCHTRLMTDTPKTMARRLYAAAKSDVPVEEAEQVVRELVGSQIRPMKTKIAKMLRDGQ
jgi:hypothetical protein